MDRFVQLQTQPVDVPALASGRARRLDQGAVLTFEGVVRDVEEGCAISGLDYEAFVPMAEHQFSLLLDELERRWPLSSVRIIHRHGPVAAGEVSLWVEVVASHRAEAFEALQHFLSEMKRRVPIWKRVLRPGSAIGPTGGSGGVCE